MTQHAGFGTRPEGFRTLPGAAGPSDSAAVSAETPAAAAVSCSGADGPVAADRTRDALVDLLMASATYIACHDGQSKARARARLRNAMARAVIVLDASQPDPPAVVCEPVIICTPVERSSPAEVLPGPLGGVVGEGSPVAVRDDNVPPAGPPGDSPPDEDLAGEPSAPDAEPLPAREPIPEPAPDDTYAGGGAPAKPRPCRLILNGEWCLEHNAPALRESDDKR